MNTMHSYGLHTPRPRKMKGTHPKHIAAHPIKTGMPSSGGGTAPGHGRMAKRMKKRGFSMPRPDKHGYYPA